jgi:hypothetical protein
LAKRGEAAGRPAVEEGETVVRLDEVAADDSLGAVVEID